MVALFICGLGPTLLTMGVWIDDRHWPFFLMQVHGDLASLFSPSSVPLSFVGSVLCGCSGCERVLPESVTGMLATSSPGYIKPYWCASKMLPKLADDADAAKTVGGDRCYLSSPAPSSQIVPCNKAINLIDQHINFIATFTLQLGGIYCLKTKTPNEGGLGRTDASQGDVLRWKPSPCSSLCGLTFSAHLQQFNHAGQMNLERYFFQIIQSKWIWISFHVLRLTDCYYYSFIFAIAQILNLAGRLKHWLYCFMSCL